MDPETFNQLAARIEAHARPFVDNRSTRPLQHVYPQYEPPEDDPLASEEEYREVWNGYMRIVHARRARVLRRRGVPLLKVESTHGHSRYAWFVEWDSVKASKIF